MRIIGFSFIICILASLFNCNGVESSTNPPKDPSQDGDKKTEITTGKNNVNELDTLVNELKNQVKCLQDSVKKGNSEALNIKKNVEEIETKSFRNFFILYILGIVSISVNVIVIIQLNTLKQKYRKIKQGSNPTDKNKPHDHQDISRGLTMHDKGNISRINERLLILEREIKTLNKKSNTSTNDVIKPQEIVRRNDSIKTQETGYFGDIIGKKYFRVLFNSINDLVVFSAKIKGDEAYFQPISLDVLKGNDNPRDAIEFEAGGLRTQDASTMTIVDKGIAKKDGSDKWVITKKVKIKLS